MPDTRVLIVAHPSLAQLLQRTVNTAEPGGDIHVTGVAATAAEAIALMAAEQFVRSLQHTLQHRL